MENQTEAYDRILRTYRTYNQAKIKNLAELIEENGFRNRDSFGNTSVYEKGHMEIEIGETRVKTTQYTDEFLQQGLEKREELSIRRYLQDNFSLVNTRIADDTGWIEGETVDVSP